MPHSSGGGSHSGGSFHSSSISSSSNHSNEPHVESFKRSHKPFRHCHTYYYYRPDGIHYVYTNKKIEEETSKPLSKFAKTFLYSVAIVLLICGSLLIKTSFNYVPSKLDSKEESRVIDSANIINFEDQLTKQLKEFKDLTGIAFVFETVNNEDWQNYYGELVNYAYESYITKLNDEKSWLIVYSQPQEVDSKFNDWYWEGMVGDETGEIITDSIAEKFGDYFQKELLKTGSVEDSLNSSITYIMTTIMAPRVNDGAIVGGCALVFIGLLITVIVYGHEASIKKRGYHDSELYEFKDGQVLKTCPYCKKEFLNTGFKKCPFCEELLSKEN